MLFHSKSVFVSQQALCSFVCVRFAVKWNSAIFGAPRPEEGLAAASLSSSLLHELDSVRTREESNEVTRQLLGFLQIKLLSVPQSCVCVFLNYAAGTLHIDSRTLVLCVCLLYNVVYVCVQEEWRWAPWALAAWARRPRRLAGSTMRSRGSSAGTRRTPGGSSSSFCSVRDDSRSRSVVLVRRD